MVEYGFQGIRRINGIIPMVEDSLSMALMLFLQILDFSIVQMVCVSPLDLVLDFNGCKYHLIFFSQLS